MKYKLTVFAPRLNLGDMGEDETLLIIDTDDRELFDELVERAVTDRNGWASHVRARLEQDGKTSIHKMEEIP